MSVDFDPAEVWFTGGDVLTRMWVVLQRDPLAAWGAFYWLAEAEDFAEYHGGYILSVGLVPEGCDDIRAVWFNGDWANPKVHWSSTLARTQAEYRDGHAIPVQIPDDEEPWHRGDYNKIKPKRLRWKGCLAGRAAAGAMRSSEAGAAAARAHQ